MSIIDASQSPRSVFFLLFQYTAVKNIRDTLQWTFCTKLTAIFPWKCNGWFHFRNNRWDFYHFWRNIGRMQLSSKTIDLLSIFPWNSHWRRKMFYIQFNEPGRNFSNKVISIYFLFSTHLKIAIWSKTYIFFRFGDVQLLSNRSAKHWDREKGYEYKYRRPDIDPFEDYPLRTFRTGSNSGFHVILKILYENIDKLCDGAMNGFRVTFHTPYEFPYFTKLQYYISPKRATDFLITPKVIFPSPGLHTYDPIIRQCYFPSERTLKFFKIYTQGNCQLECAWNVTLEECDCYTLTMPSKYDRTSCRSKV